MNLRGMDEQHINDFWSASICNEYTSSEFYISNISIRWKRHNTFVMKIHPLLKVNESLLENVS